MPTPTSWRDKDGRLIRAYMAYDIDNGAEEGAVLVFAHNTREARRISFGCDGGFAGWIDWTAKWIKALPPHLHPDPCDPVSPHVIEFPKTCETCKLWGGVLFGEDEGCSLCEEA